MDYKNKYLKYKLKYYNLMNQIGGNINEIFSIINSKLGDSWVLTGSQAVKKLNEAYTKYDLPFIPNDIDILYISNDLTLSPSLLNSDEFTPKQTSPERSITYTKGDVSIDITIVNSAKYINVDGIKILSPKVLLEFYEDYGDDTEKTEQKRNILRNIVSIIDLYDIKTLTNKKVVERTPITGRRGRSLFDEFTDEKENKITPDNLVRRSLFEEDIAAVPVSEFIDEFIKDIDKRTPAKRIRFDDE
jgi:hypothetical protein